MKSGGTFTVTLMTSGGVKDVFGKVWSVELIDGTPPTTWKIIMEMPSERRR